jgi:hypothetical protein
VSAHGRISWVRRTLPAAGLGPANPLPHFADQQPIKRLTETRHHGLNALESKDRFDWGVDSILPYQVQDAYDRRRVQTDVQLLEYTNGRLTASVAPQLGGRLLRLWDEEQQRDLVFCNPVFQPANLGALNAWFSGGIEWNGLIPGHSPFTCSPVFAGAVDTARGQVLRLFEFDRVTESCWQIDLFLPADDDRLFIHGRIVNPDPWVKHVYWWTNIAVPASPGMRVLSPADYSLEHVLPGNQLERKPFPDLSRFDGSYPDRWNDATSVFFRTEKPSRPWIAALDANGAGVGLMSSAAMHGRKFFYFGAGPGGQHWMDYLSEKGKGAYIEIQSGLMPTQNQRFALPANGDQHWTHALGFIQLDRTQTHQSDYQGAIAYANESIQARFDIAEFEEIDDFLHTVSCLPLNSRLHQGSAWGERQERLLKTPLFTGMEFAVNKAQGSSTPWDILLSEGDLGAINVLTVPDDWVVSPRWCQLLQQNADRYGQSWLHALALGIEAHNRGSYQEAIDAYAASLQIKPTWLTWRQMALLHTNVSAQKEAYFQAATMPDAPPQLYVEIATFLTAIKDLSELKRFINSLPSQMLTYERIRIAQAHIAVIEKDWPRLAELLDFPFASIREGETTLHELWFSMQKAIYSNLNSRGAINSTWQEWVAAHALPSHLDFRLSSAELAFEKIFSWD